MDKMAVGMKSTMNMIVLAMPIGASAVNTSNGHAHLKAKVKAKMTKVSRGSRLSMQVIRNIVQNVFSNLQAYVCNLQIFKQG